MAGEWPELLLCPLLVALGMSLHSPALVPCWTGGQAFWDVALALSSPCRDIAREDQGAGGSWGKRRGVCARTAEREVRCGLWEEVFRRQVAMSRWRQGERLRLVTRMDSESRWVDGIVARTPDDTSVLSTCQAFAEGLPCSHAPRQGCSCIHPPGEETEASCPRHAVRTCRTGTWTRGV